MSKKAANSVDALQSVLRGEFMAISVYNAVLNTIDEPQLKQRLEEVRDGHERHAQQIALQIEQLGGEPIDGAGIAAWMARAGIRIRGWYDHDPRIMLRQVYDGEDQGIAATVRVTHDKLDDESRALIERIMAEDRDHLGLLEQEIARQSGDLQ